MAWHAFFLKGILWILYFLFFCPGYWVFKEKKNWYVFQNISYCPGLCSKYLYFPSLCCFLLTRQHDAMDLLLLFWSISSVYWQNNYEKKMIPLFIALTTGSDIALPLILHIHSITKACGYLFPKCLSNRFLSSILADIVLVCSNIISQLDYCNNFITDPCSHSTTPSILCIVARVVFSQCKLKMTSLSLKSLNGFV